MCVSCVHSVLIMLIINEANKVREAGKKDYRVIIQNKKQLLEKVTVHEVWGLVNE